jgi:signal transduction histidine kinase
VNKLLLPLPAMPSSATLLIRIEETVGRGGVYSGIRIGEFDDLTAGFIRQETDDMALSSGMIMVGLIMLACSGFLPRGMRKFWLSLSVIALAAGSLIFTSSPMPYLLFGSRAEWLQTAFELALYVAAPAFMHFADIVFQGRYLFYTRLRQALWGYAALCFLIYVLDVLMPGRFETGFELIAVKLLNLTMLAGFATTAALAAVDAFRGNRNGAVLSGGIFILTSSAAADLIMYFARGEQYEPVLWKFGTLALLVALIIILSAELASNHAALIAYTREREEYNRRLQRAEKLRIISDLAASVAHEVRNPLQVTRGFLQLLAEREMPNRRYYDMAIEELDRASAIITDFLTFAKPEMEEFTVLDLTDELGKINAIMTPHASLNGVALRFDVRDGLRIEGNSSRFKQAIINFIKNGHRSDGGWRRNHRPGIPGGPSGGHPHPRHRKRHGRGADREARNSLLLDQDEGHRPRPDGDVPHHRGDERHHPLRERDGKGNRSHAPVPRHTSGSRLTPCSRKIPHPVEHFPENGIPPHMMRHFDQMPASVEAESAAVVQDRAVRDAARHPRLVQQPAVRRDVPNHARIRAVVIAAGRASLGEIPADLAAILEAGVDLRLRRDQMRGDSHARHEHQRHAAVQHDARGVDILDHVAPRSQAGPANRARTAYSSCAASSTAARTAGDSGAEERDASGVPAASRFVSPLISASTSMPETSLSICGAVAMSDVT